MKNSKGGMRVPFSERSAKNMEESRNIGESEVEHAV